MSLFGLSLPRQSKLYRQFHKALKMGPSIADAFLSNLSIEQLKQLTKEAQKLAVDEMEQNLIEQHRKEIESKSFPIMFSQN